MNEQIEQAIETIKANWPTRNYTMLIAALDLAISALGKQVPMKPFYVTEMLDWMCPKPKCDTYLDKDFLYCPACGQCIDWGDET